MSEKKPKVITAGPSVTRMFTKCEPLGTDPDCPECAYEKETGHAAPVPHHCDQEAQDAGYYHSPPDWPVVEDEND